MPSYPISFLILVSQGKPIYPVTSREHFPPTYFVTSRTHTNKYTIKSTLGWAVTLGTTMPLLKMSSNSAKLDAGI